MLDPVETDEPALWVHRGAAPPMREFHRHDDLEINVVLEGDLSYLFGGERITVPSGHTAMFWAAAPHRLIAPDEVRPSDICWIHVPLAVVLRWSLPSSFGSRVLSQDTVVVPTSVTGDHVVARLEAWQHDLDSGVNAEAVLLELNALVLRILSEEVPPAAAPLALGSRPDLRPVALMARFIAEHFRSPVTALDVAGAANLNPNYATTLFRKSIGITLGEQLLRHRVAEAQRLLVTTSMTTAAVAHAAGFGSASSFYAHFARACGCSPGAYRATRTAAHPPGGVR